MYKKFGLLLISAVIVASVQICAHGINNPLKSYNLYEDTHRGDTAANSERESVMDEYYNNSMRAPKSSSSKNKNKSAKNPPSTTPDFSQKLNEYQPEYANYNGRNHTLRDSSRKVYSNPSQPGAWEEGPYFYGNPNLDSIKSKYQQSNFAGCMQEAEAYVAKNPNDTLGFYYLAMSYTKVNDRENAIKAYERVISLNDNPMIVKYATNGRNCILNSGSEKCYQDVNEPEYIYPYANIVSKSQEQQLTPINPQDLINKNISDLQSKLIDNESGDGKKGKDTNLPFRNQDDDLDKFINAPYGNGLSPELNNEYKTIQLKKLQQNINNNQDLQNNFYNNIKNFDRGSDSGLAKLAYIDPSNLDKLSNSPEYIQAQKELEEIRMLLGRGSSNKNDDDFMELLLSGDAENVSPEVIQTMMLQSIATDFTGNN